YAFVAHGSKAKLFDDVLTVVIAEGRQLEIGARLPQKIQTEDPLFHAVVPPGQLQTAADNFGRKQSGGHVSRRRFYPLRAQLEVAKTNNLIRKDASGRWVVHNPLFTSHIFREQFFEPVALNRGRKSQHRVDIACATTDFLDVGDHHQSAA